MNIPVNSEHPGIQQHGTRELQVTGLSGWCFTTISLFRMPTASNTYFFLGCPKKTGFLKNTRSFYSRLLVFHVQPEQKQVLEALGVSIFDPNEGYFHLCNVNIQTTWGRYQLSLVFFSPLLGMEKNASYRQLLVL